MIQINLIQERQIAELQQFIRDTLSDIFSTVNMHERETLRTLKNQGLLPPNAAARKDPFGLYNSYLSMVKPINYADKRDNLKAEIENLKMRLQEEIDRAEKS